MELAPLSVAVPLLAAAGLTAAGTRVGRTGSELVAIAAAVASSTFSAILLARTASGLSVYWFGGWQPRHGTAIGVSFAIDTYGAGLATLVGVLMVLALAV